jgi:ribonuclease-3
MKNLQEKLGYTFKDEAFLKRALHHSSCDIKDDEGLIFNNERLEFVGDRILGLVIANMVYESFEDAKEGLLAKRHTALVRQEALAHVAEKIQLGELVEMSVGEERSGGRNKPSILSDAMEAVIAAIYFDGGYEEADKFIRTNWTEMMHRAKGITLRDAKSQLQEYIQKHTKKLPVYEVLEILGEAHERTFVLKVSAEGYGEATGTGASKQQAAQAAALSLLEALGEM